MKYKHMTSISVIALCAAASLTGAHAQNASESVVTSVESVTVTARQRSENIQDVPVSIQAVSAEDLNNRDIKSIDELYRLAPTLAVEERGSGQAAVILRGIGTVSFSAAVDPSIATVIDGVVMGTSNGGMFSKFSDIDRVEVLKGPQGTLFGKNASAGVLQIVTKDPTKDFEGRVGVEQGSYDEAMLDGSLSGAIVGDKLMGRVSFYADDRNGYIYNLYDGRMLGSDFQVGVRGKLLYELSDTTKVKLTGVFLQREQHEGVVYNIASQLNAYSYSYENQYLSAIAGPTNDKANSLGDRTDREQTQNLSLEVNQQLGDYTLTSITAWQHWKWNDDSPLDYQPTPVLPVVVPDNSLNTNVRQYSQELRIASPENQRVDFVAGAFLFTQRDHYDLEQRANFAAQGNVITPAYISSFGFAPAVNTVLENALDGKGIQGYNSERSYTDTLNYAAFGEANTHITDTLTLITGARVTREEKKIHLYAAPPPAAYSVSTGLSAPYPATVTIPMFGFLASSYAGPNGQTIDDRASATNFSWRLGARWEPTAGMNVYATVSKGFKGPGFNTNTGTGTAQKVAPETSTAYEVGAKTRFWDDRISANLALFRTDLKNFQAESEKLVYDNQGHLISAAYELQNAGGMRTQGVELEVQAVPMEGLMLDGNIAYTDARYTSYIGGNCYTNQTVAEGCVGGVQNLTGAFVPIVPEWAFNLGAQYEFPISSGPFYGTARVDYNWRSKVQWDYANAPNAIEKGYGLLGLSFGVENKDKHYRLIGYLKNVTNQYHTAGMSGGNATVYNTLSPDYQRTYGIRLEYNF